MFRICASRSGAVAAGSGAPGIRNGSIPGPSGAQKTSRLRVAVSFSSESECSEWTTDRRLPLCADQIAPSISGRPSRNQTNIAPCELWPPAGLAYVKTGSGCSFSGTGLSRPASMSYSAATLR